MHVLLRPSLCGGIGVNTTRELWRTPLDECGEMRRRHPLVFLSSCHFCLDLWGGGGGGGVCEFSQISCKRLVYAVMNSAWPSKVLLTEVATVERNSTSVPLLKSSAFFRLFIYFYFFLSWGQLEAVVWGCCGESMTTASDLAHFTLAVFGGIFFF